MAKVDMNDKLQRKMENFEFIINNIKSAQGKLEKRCNEIIERRQLNKLFSNITESYTSVFNDMKNGKLTWSTGLIGALAALPIGTLLGGQPVLSLCSAISTIGGLHVGGVLGNLGVTVFDINEAKKELEELSSQAKNAKQQLNSFKETLDQVKSHLNYSIDFISDAIEFLQSEEYTGSNKVKKRVKKRKNEIETLLTVVDEFTTELLTYMNEIDSVIKVIG